MIYEFRTYTLHPRTLPEVLKRWTDALEPRLKLSPLAAFWYTEIGPLNQIIHVWPYENTLERSKIRADAVKRGIWPPKTSERHRGAQPVDAHLGVQEPRRTRRHPQEGDIGGHLAAAGRQPRRQAGDQDLVGRPVLADPVGRLQHAVVTTSAVCALPTTAIRAREVGWASCG
jgi:NIPSNAP